MLTTLSRLHDSLIPSLRRGFRNILSGDDGIISDVSVSLKMLSNRIVGFGWKLLDICYFSEEVFEGGTPIQGLTKMFPAKVEDPTVRADILVQTFRDINGVSLQVREDQKGYTFLQGMEKNHNISSKLENLQSSGQFSFANNSFELNIVSSIRYCQTPPIGHLCLQVFNYLRSSMSVAVFFLLCFIYC